MTAPDGPGWLHEIKLDGYRMHARVEAGRVQILTRRGNGWSAKYPTIAKALAELSTHSAYLDSAESLLAAARARIGRPSPRGTPLIMQRNLKAVRL
jgi:hypothetical protein